MTNEFKSEKRERLLKQFSRDNDVTENLISISQNILNKLKEMDCSVDESQTILKQIFDFAEVESNGIELIELVEKPQDFSVIVDYCIDFKIKGFVFIDNDDFITKSAMLIYSSLKKEDLELYEIATSLQFAKNTIEFDGQFVRLSL